LPHRKSGNCSDDESDCTLRPRDEVEGSGMGLALIKKLVERWGGRVSVTSSAETRGSTFRFTLPAPVRSAA
jgi:signal transduction histidine kinase